MPELGEDLSGREIDVLKCVADGATNKEVGQILDISPYTVKTHLRNIYTKLDAGSRTEAIRIGMEKGFLTAPNQASVPSAVVNGNGVLAMEATAVSPQAPSVPVAEPAGLPETKIEQDDPKTTNWQRLVLIGLFAILLIGAGTWFFIANSPFSNNISYTVEEMGNKWSVIRDVSFVRPEMATTAVGLSVYQVGGSESNGPSDQLIIMDTVENIVSQGTAKPTAVSNAASAALYGEIYVIGGEGSSGSPLGIVEAFSPTNNAWRPITSLPTPLRGALAIANQDALFVIGGHDGDTAVETFYQFDLNQESWIQLPDMPIAVENAAGAIIGRSLIVVGGENESGTLASCSKFDLDGTEGWSTCQDLLTPRTGAQAVAFFGRLYLFGGQLAPLDETHIAEIYNTELDAWEPVDTPSEFDQWTDWSGLGVTLVGDKIYISGGEINGTVSKNTYIFAPFPNRVYLPTTQND